MRLIFYEKTDRYQCKIIFSIYCLFDLAKSIVSDAGICSKDRDSEGYFTAVKYFLKKICSWMALF